MPQHRIGIVLNGPLATERAKVSFPPPLNAAFHNETKFDLLYFVDGGIVHQKTLSLHANAIAWIGDCDSCSIDGPQLFEKEQSLHPQTTRQLTFPQDKDFSDFAAALRDITQISPPNQNIVIEIFCGLGGRRDHEEANLREAALFLQQRQAPCALVFHPGIALANCTVDLNIETGEPFSLFSLAHDRSVSLNISGATYSGALTLSRPSHGISNRAAGTWTQIAPLERNPFAVYLV